ncbi:ornithine cyclodeaminase [Nonomuraea polychroma]|uniref:Ornithine cyclodeaminase n=1 Tax=Nonomuraea polychroma TaxID=46176 RepID=A0A438M941_9ACTN|nr:ornithine cyclodeaminase family protein [Nonomuraea polychroma]RVX42230.1 ornithine cyclodeaminase [Nonomuraea polychroma]
MTDALPYLDAATLERLLPVERAVGILEDALRAGLDPEATPQRPVVDVPAGQLLLMPAAAGRYVGVKAVTIAPGNPERGLPRIQGTYLLLDGDTLAPLAAMDGIAITSLRTPAVSALAVRHLADPQGGKLVVFGSGPQAWGHVLALREVRPVTEVTIIARDLGRAESLAARCRTLGLPSRALASTLEPHAAGGSAPVGRRRQQPLSSHEPAAAAHPVSGAAAVGQAVAEADLIVCCTTAREPLFPGKLARDGVTVVAVGSHEPGARELDDDLIARATVVVEARTAALAEAGDVIIPIHHGTITTGHLAGNLAELIAGQVVAGPGPRVFKSTGMAWEDLVIAAAAYEAWI